LNTRVPPFNDVRARQAVSYALDREKLAQIHGGQKTAQVTCQLLPPNFPGYRPYCPFTADASAGGAWSAPDLVSARELVRQSGTAGARVTFWGWNAPAAAKEVDLARSLFRQLGYRVSVKIFPDINAYFDALASSPPIRLPQGAINGWFADYPAASNFFGIISCTTAGNPATNPSGFCSRDLDAKVKHASVLQAQDQDVAAKLWAEVDRDVTKLAPVIPTYTPRNVDLVSKRVGNYQHHPLFGVLLDQLWVR
jgi:peptide/nickel transport system substrate-binding protein